MNFEYNIKKETKAMKKFNDSKLNKNWQVWAKNCSYSFVVL